MQWYRFRGQIRKTEDKLNWLLREGVNPEHVLTTSSSFGEEIYYCYHEELIPLD